MSVVIDLFLLRCGGYQDLDAVYDEHFGRDETGVRRDEATEKEKQAGIDSEEWHEDSNEVTEETEGKINVMLQNENQDDRVQLVQ